jgi:hypothetical protein
MNPSFRQWLTLWIALVGALVSCGPRPTEPSLILPTSFQPTVQPTPILGVEQAGPLPEYRIILTLDPVERRLAGQQQVTIPNRSGVDLDEIVFRLYPNLPQYGGLMGIGPTWADGERVTSFLRADGTSLVLPLLRPLAPDESVTVGMTFDAEIPQKEEGYVLFGYSQGIWSVPDAYPLLAVHGGSMGLTGARATWHEDIAPPHGDAVFSDAAFYDVTLTLPPTLTLVTTGSVVSDTVNATGQRVYRIVGGPLREFAWLASADYLVAETTAYGTTLHSYYLPGDEAGGQASLNIAAAALRTYEDTFGPYPFDEMTVAEAPLLYYGMEYPGLNLIGVDHYREQRTELEDRIVHEIAHQWWYAQVGNDQVNTPWLDEGLAEYSMAIYYGQVYGQARVNTLINQRWLVPYQVAVENEYDAVVNQPSTAFFPWQYEVIVYGKAALFFNALRQELGDEIFERVLREYLDRYRWRIATPDDFLTVAESVSGQDLDGLYNQWILGKQ